MRRMIQLVRLVAVLLWSAGAHAQDFTQTATPVPQHHIKFSLRTPLVHPSSTSDAGLSTAAGCPSTGLPRVVHRKRRFSYI